MTPTGRCPRRWPLAAGLALFVLTLGLSSSLAQQRRPDPQPELLDLPRMEEKKSDKDQDGNGKKTLPDVPLMPQDYPGGLYPGIPVTLPDVLKLAVLSNLDVAQANLAVERARVAVLRANAQFLPNLSLGVQHQSHDGTIQKTEGNIIDVDRDSLFVGGGPTITLPFSRALFGPGQARQLLEAAVQGQARVTLETLVRVADAYFAVLRARRQLARLDEVLDMLTSERDDPLRGNSKGLLPLIKAFVRAGTALPSDQARVEADVVRRHGERIRALEDVRVASAELARLLHLNPGYFLLPVEDYRFPLQLPGEAWYKTPVEELIAQALRARPELAESQALIEAAILRYRQAKYEPLLPTVQAGLSYGGFGGGPELKRNPRGTTFFGDSGNIRNFDSRTDLDLAVVWRLENMGVGNAARIRDARLQTQQAEVRLRFLQDLVVTQVVQSMESVQRGEARYRVYRAGLFDDEGKPAGAVYNSLRLNFIRIKGGQGLPLEVLDSTRRHSDVLQGYADTLSDYDRARFRLLLALALPMEALIDPAKMPSPKCAPPAAYGDAAAPPTAPQQPSGNPDNGERLPAPKPGADEKLPPPNKEDARLLGTPMPAIGQAVPTWVIQLPGQTPPRK
jgi:outer membrane protein TolC